MYILCMQPLYGTLKIGISVFIKSLLSPKSFFPAVPILNDTIYRYVSVSECFSDAFKFLCGSIAFFTLNISERPTRKHRRFSRKLMIKLNEIFYILTQKNIVRKHLCTVYKKLYQVFFRLKYLAALGIYQNSVVPGRYKERDCYTHIGFIEILRMISVIEYPVFILSHTKQHFTFTDIKPEFYRIHFP